MSALLVGVASAAISTPISGTYIFPAEHPHPFGNGDELKGSMLKLSQLHGLPQLANKNKNRNKNCLILLFFWYSQRELNSRRRLERPVS
jgi:hypothetical protein|tara:strand:- start:514 stop:780 length:267 start_codon:yes stop_codon:yes gene_type:complete